MRMDRFRGQGEEVVDIIRQLIKEGNVRRLVVKNANEKVLMNLPITLVFFAAFSAPFLSGVLASLAVVKSCSVEVEYLHSIGDSKETEKK